MELPSERWPQAIFEKEILDNIQKDFESCQGQIIEFVEHLYQSGDPPGMTPELTACTIGQVAYEKHKSDDYFVKAFENIEGEEGKKLARGYIGIQAMKEANC